MGIDPPCLLADHTVMRSTKDSTASLILLPLIVIAIGVGVFAAYAVTVVASLIG